MAHNVGNSTGNSLTCILAIVLNNYIYKIIACIHYNISDICSHAIMNSMYGPILVLPVVLVPVSDMGF